MKKNVIKFTAILLVIASLSSYATVFGGKVSDCQRTKPAVGEPARKVRVGALIANILFFTPGLIVDFATGAAYRPCEK
jgi:hypothetical protein